MYVNEQGTIDRLIEMLAEHRENHPGVPYFNFTVTIQNHGPYNDKYLYDGPVTEANFSTDLDLSEADINALSNYFHGLHDADRELRRLADYLNTLDEPVVLVYFGDHNPALNARTYDIILPDEALLYRVPFMVYAIGKAKSAFELLRQPNEELLFSSPYLGAYVLELLGMTNISPFWDYVAGLRRKFPVISESENDLSLYRDWSYYKVFHE